MTDHVGKITISHARIKAQSQRQTAKGKTNFVLKKIKSTGKDKKQTEKYFVIVQLAENDILPGKSR